MSTYLVNLEVGQGDPDDPTHMCSLSLVVGAPGGDPQVALDRAVARTEELLTDADPKETYIVVEVSTVELHELGKRAVVVHSAWRPLNDGKQGFLNAESDSPEDRPEITVYSSTPDDATDVAVVLELNVPEEDEP